MIFAWPHLEISAEDWRVVTDASNRCASGLLFRSCFAGSDQARERALSTGEDLGKRARFIRSSGLHTAASPAGRTSGAVTFLVVKLLILEPHPLCVLMSK